MVLGVALGCDLWYGYIHALLLIPIILPHPLPTQNPNPNTVSVDSKVINNKMRATLSSSFTRRVHVASRHMRWVNMSVVNRISFCLWCHVNDKECLCLVRSR